jgi:thiol-disulfide isomerase/thioredoxin
MMKMTSVCISVILITLVYAAAPRAYGRDASPSLTLKDLHGKKVKLSDLRGKIVVLNFWATWCAPCRAEMPLLAKSAAAYTSKNVVFVGVSVDEAADREKVSSYVQHLGIGYAIWVGATDEDLKRLELGNAVPGTAFLDADGNVRARILGQMQPGEIEERLDWLLGGTRVPEPLIRHLDEK